MNKIISLLVFFLISQASFGQVKVQVFDGNGSEAETKSTRDYSLNDQNLISLNTYLLGRGIFALSYERVFSPKHSLAFTGGLTYRDLIFEQFNKDDIDGSNNKSNSYQVSKTGTKSQAGYMFDISYKFYPKSYDDFEGFYLSPGFIYKHYSYKDKISPNALNGNSYSYTYNYSNTLKDIEQPVTYNLSELSFKLGYMYESWWYDDLMIDVYCGFGYRMASITGYEAVQVPDPDAPSMFPTYYNYQLKATTTTIQYPCVYLGAKFGIPF